VEVIVVLVILAILMAIAVPALTGYIDKAKDKKWEMRARDISLAVHSVLDEEYAKGNIDDTYVTNGEPGLASTNMKCWAAQKLTQDSSDSRATAATLLGEVYPGGGNPGNWGFNLIGPATAGSMPWNADGFYIDNRPVTGSSEWTYITYKVTPLVFASRAEFANALKNASYNASAGMYVYHVTE
jgi:type II secretory pathway pseudopilin PulG